MSGNLLSLRIEPLHQGGVCGVGFGVVLVVGDGTVPLEACLGAEKQDSQGVRKFQVAYLAVLQVLLAVFLEIFVAVQKFILELEGRIEQRVVADAEIPQQGLVGVFPQGVVVEAVGMLDVQRVCPGGVAPVQVGQGILFDFVSAGIDIGAENQVLDGVEFKTCAIAAAFDGNAVGVCLEGALGLVQGVKDYFVGGIVGIVKVHVVHLHESLAESETPGQHGLHVDAVHGDVSSTEGDRGGVAAQGKIGGMGHVLVLVFLAVLVGATLDAKVQGHRVGDDAPEIQPQGVAVEGATLPGQVSDGGIYGNPVPLFGKDSVFAVQGQGGAVVAKLCCLESRKLARESPAYTSHAKGRGVQLRVPENRCSQYPFRFLTRHVVGPLHQFPEGDDPAARVVFADGRIRAVGGVPQGVLGARLGVGAGRQGLAKYGPDHRQDCKQAYV